jgi:predicted extracellular nuclease
MGGAAVRSCLLGLTLVVPGLVVASGNAAAVSADVLVSEVYGGGGNSGATYTHDFIELVNTSGATVDVSGWSLQYASAAGGSWQVTALVGSIPAGGRYLVQEAQGAGGTTPLPSPDASGTIPMSATTGKVALVTNQTPLTCSTGCVPSAAVRDFVGYGATASSFEGSGPTADTANTTSAARPSPEIDTDDNAVDYVVGLPTPGGVTTEPPGIEGLEIHDIQGATHVSPYVGEHVLDVPGVVTAVRNNGFWMQSPLIDADPATSEGLFVFTSSAPAVAVGAAVAVTGDVAEFRAGGASSANLTTTELTAPTVTVAGSVPPPAVTLVGPGGRVPPGEVIDDDASGSVETSGAFDAASDGIDFWESMEGMLLRIQDAAVVGPSTSFGEIPVVPGGAQPRTTRGGVVVSATDFNPERIILDDVLAAMPTGDVGDSIPGPTVGVLDYSFGNFKLLPVSTPTMVAGGLARELTGTPRGSQLALATFNVENLDPSDPPDKFGALANQIVTNLRSPDVIALEEVQDNSGPVNDGTVDADLTLRLLTEAIQQVGGPTYQARQINPVDNAEGGEPGGNIRVAFLFRPDRGVQFVDRSAADITANIFLDRKGQAHLVASPARIDPGSTAWTNSRVPLVGEFVWKGNTFFAIATHFSSKGGDDPLFGRFQPPTRSSEVARHQQAGEVRAFVDQVLAAEPDARVAVLGDLNDFDFSQTANILVGFGTTALTDLPRTLPTNERYTYVFEGNSQVLDHILLSSRFVRDRFQYDVVHTNAEFHDQISDHDAQVVRLGKPNEH